jgi:hypothetical protein
MGEPHRKRSHLLARGWLRSSTPQIRHLNQSELQLRRNCACPNATWTIFANAANHTLIWVVGTSIVIFYLIKVNAPYSASDVATILGVRQG